MDTQQNSTSAQPSPNGPVFKASQNTDLYDAITKEDDEIFRTSTKKKKNSPFMSLVVFFMKVTFYFDSQKRTYESLFHFLGGIWTGFMALIYLGGIVALFLVIYSRMRLPLYLENFFDDHHLKYDSLKIVDYSLSKIEIRGLHDNENIYKIPLLIVNSTFADFLRGHIRTITVDDLELNLTSQMVSDNNTIEHTLKILGMLTNPTESGLDLRINNSITVNRAILTIENEGKKIPISFSISGLYTNNAQVVIPFSVNEPSLKMDATITIKGPVSNRELVLDIKSGTIALKNRAPEDLQGTVTAQISGNQIKTLSSQLNLNYTTSLKEIKTSLTKAGDNFNGNISFVYKNTSEGQSEIPIIDASLEFENVSFTKDGNFQTSSPLLLKINRLAHNFTLVEGIEGKLSGELVCSFSNQECQYSLAKEGLINYQKLKTQYKDQNIVIDEPDKLLFKPTKDTLVFNMENSVFSFNWDLQKVNLDGFYNVQTNALHLAADEIQINGKVSSYLNGDTLTVKTKEALYETAQLKMRNITLNANNLLDETAPIYFSSKEVNTASPLLTKSVSVDMTYLDRQMKATVQVKDTDILVTAEGVFKPFQKTFSGIFRTSVVNLQDIPFALSELSPIFSKRLNKVSGKAMAAGRLNFAGTTNITGPLYIGLEDVNFYLDNTEIKRLNSVVTLRSLSPLISSGNQFASIGKIDTLVPLTNVTSQFKFENQSIRLLDLNAQLGNKNLNLTTALIPYRDPNALLHLKSEKDFHIDSIIPYLNLKGITLVGGNGTLSIPINISEAGIKIPSATLKVDNVTLKQDPNTQDFIGFFEQGNNAYMVRNGQFVLDDDRRLNVDLDGWLMPMRTREAFSKQDIQLTEPLFKSGTINPVPTEIKKLQDSLEKLVKGEK